MPDTTTTTRPAPILTDDNRLFWEAARDERLVGQRCVSCRRFRHPPRPMCPQCQSLDHQEVELSGHGIVYSYSLLHHPRNPLFEYPVIAALVDLDEGIRVVSNLVDVDPGAVRIGMPVKVGFAATTEGMKVPVFRPGGVHQ
jgi:uncharacterized OB-fold protein